MDTQTKMELALQLREAAAELVAYAENLEFLVKLEKASALPNGNLIALLLKAEKLRKEH
jgi:hypothetical protein